MRLYPVILCGGSGTRLWPASRADRPKQFLPLLGERSLFQETVLRLAQVAGAEPPLIVAGAAHEGWVTGQLAALGVAGVVMLEPEGRDSGPAIAAAAAWIARSDPEGVAVIVASDHHVPDPAAFAAAVAVAAAATAEGAIVTFGVRPTSPSTAYGYIRPEPGDGPVARVGAFVEKPDEATARRCITEGCLWNSGNFVARAQGLLEAFERYAPEVAAGARAALAQAPAGAVVRLGPAFAEAPKISVDYAVMERTDRAAVLPVSFAWSDLGAWDAVWAASAKDSAGAATAGDVLLEDARDLLVRAEAGTTVAVVGVSGVAVVAERHAVLVVGLDSAQGVKAVAERLKTRASDGPAGPSLAALAERQRRWLFGSALPVWWTLGADHARGGFEEALTHDGAPLKAARRARVQARQAYSFAVAGGLGWPGPWRQAAEHGLKALRTHYRRPDGLYRALWSPDGEVDGFATLYDQAFVLLALASLTAADPARWALEAEALDLLGAVQDRFAHAGGGFSEAVGEAFQANANMHLLEAALAWEAAGGGPAWRDVADTVVALCLERFIDPAGEFLREFFDADWRPAAGAAGRLVEPGHQFEWAWLLLQWSRRRGRGDLAPVIGGLYAAGSAGVDRTRGVAIDQRLDDGGVLSPRARLWPQTERIRAALALHATTGDARYAADAAQAARALWRYLETPVPGLWRDRQEVDGSFVEEPAPASSLYHIIGAVAAMQAVEASGGG